MTTLYIICAIIIASIVAFTAFVIIGSIERKKHININWVLLMVTIILGCSLTMVLIYHSQNDITLADTQVVYNNGYEDGLKDSETNYPSNESIEKWMSTTQKVVVGVHEDGSDPVIHIVDSNGEEWVLIADEVNQNG